MPIKIGHRGAMGYAPENTLKSFQKALELGVDMIELDVHLCKTGELVVIHDAAVDRTTDGNGFVKAKTLKELKSLDAGTGEKIPLLSEVFDLVERQAKINIELKGPATAKPARELIEYYVNYRSWAYDDFMISSFDHAQLKLFRKLNKQVKIGILVGKFPVSWARLAKKINAYSVNMSFKLISRSFVEKVHEKGLKVYVWTVNDPEDIKKMNQLRVDGIFSNFPDRL